MDSATPAFELRHDVYRKMRQKQAAALQSTAIDRLISGIRSSAASSEGAGQQLPMVRSLPWPGVVQLTSNGPPYSSGNPNPEQKVSLDTGQKAVSTNAFGDPVSGHLSVGVNGGRTTTGGFGAYGTIVLPMPDSWLGGDLIRSSAAVYQVVHGIRQAAPATLMTFVDFGWEPSLQKNISIEVASGGEVPDNETAGDFLLTECTSYSPGTSDAALSGLVGLSASFEAAVTQFAGSEIVSSSNGGQSILNLAVNSQNPGATPNMGGPYLYRDWAFESSYTRTLTIPVSMPLNANADRLIIEARVHLAGFRGGVDDPNGGYVAVDFAASPSWVANTSAPFIVRGISAFIVPDSLVADASGYRTRPLTSSQPRPA